MSAAYFRHALLHANMPASHAFVPLAGLAGRRAALRATPFLTPSSRFLTTRLPPPRVRGVACVASTRLSSTSNGVHADDDAAPAVALSDDPDLDLDLPVLEPLQPAELSYDDTIASLSDLPPSAPVAKPAAKSTKAAAVKVKDGMGPALDTFRISPVTLDRLAKNGITSSTEVQAGTFDLVYDGKDIIAKSRTGTGKTLAFALPIMERLAAIRQQRGGSKPRGEGPGCIVLAPTRELAKQVAREMTYLGEGLHLSVECFYGGVAYGPQEGALRRGLDVVVGTPGRIMDHLNKGNLRLDNISFAVLDEADEMLSMGFAQDVETVFETLPPVDERQVILFSATVPRWVKSLAAQFQKPEVVTFDAVTSGSMAATTVRHCAVRVPEREEARASLLADIIAVHSRVNTTETTVVGPSRAIVFTQTKKEADELATSGSLDGCGAAVLHGDVSQKQREVTLSQFRQGQFQVLVATDVAARGLDISGVDVVVQYRVPQDSESYIHRAGRTGRAGKTGTAVVMYSDREARNLRNLERDCRIRFELEAAPAPEMALEAAAEVALGNVSTVDDRVIKHLLPKAQQILESGKNTPELVAAILAIAGRRTRLEDRSVLSGESGMKTLLLKGEFDVTPGMAMKVISDLSRQAGCDKKVGLIRLCRDGSAVIDVPSASADSLVEAAAQLGSEMQVALTLAVGVPALKESERRGGGGRYGGGGGRYGGGGGGGYRGGGGGYRGGGGGYRGGGGGGGGGYRQSRGSYRGGGGGYRDDGYRGDRGGRNDNYGGRDGGRDNYGSRDNYGGGRDNYRGRGGGGGGRRSADFLSDDF